METTIKSSEIVCKSATDIARPSKNKQLAPQPEVKAFMDVVSRKRDEALTVLEDIATIACEAQAAKEALEEDVRYVVDLGDNVKKALAQGDIKFDQDKTGNLYAQIRRANGNYGKRLPIKEEIATKGINPLDVQTAIQTQAIQQQLEEIAATLEEIGQGVSDIKQGQHDDRYGLLIGNQALYLESMQVKDPMMRKLLGTQALNSISSAGGQLMQSAKSTITYLAEKRYNELPRGQKAAVDEKVSELRQILEAVNATFAIKAEIYYSNGEVDAMLATLEQYSTFISCTVAPKAGLLAELDKKDYLPRGGFWAKKAKALDAVEEIRAKLASPENIYLLEETTEQGTDDDEER